MGLLNRAENGAQTQLNRTMQQVAKRSHYPSFGTRDFFGYNAANVEVINALKPPTPQASARPELAVQQRSAQSVSSYGATASVKAPSQTTTDVQLTVGKKLELMGIPVVSVVPFKKVVIQFNDQDVTLKRSTPTSVGVNLPPESARLLHDTLSMNKLSFLDLVNELTPKDVSRVAKPKSSWLGGIFR